MSKAASWITAIGVAGLAVALAVGVGLSLFVADVFGKAVNDRTCIASLDSLRDERTGGGTGAELRTIQTIVEKYCSEVEPAEQ